MYVNQITFTRTRPCKPDDEAVTDTIQWLLGVWRNNGQVCGREWPMLGHADVVTATVLTPEAQSLDAGFHSQYAREALARCEAEGWLVACDVLGKDVDAMATCSCKTPSAWLLFTTYESIGTPVRCMDCFKPSALYRFEAMASGDFYELMSWQTEYQCFDTLQMTCTVLEKEATRELSKLGSSLTKKGLAHCKTLAASSQKPFYYYLYRGHGRSHQAEMKRRCPGCGDAWALETPIHSIFDFKCDRCCLVSNIAFDVK
ncbi:MULTISPECIES: DUF2310 family Zn-ribbon-containing protein [Dyella]|uniref:Nucleic acid-binding protein n=2 Tax=Dyella TaxID=231454 RepID=A0A4R0YYK3_9GAMM|nr:MULTISPECIES: DUF2310 family Zn-ribbon-containing protein [Dyella]TBR40552.1 hypothetical protein EYV96_10485 [Dyella terrae]TCI11866.1 hypothetical protein EZM97_00385 [Dyella soli]